MAANNVQFKMLLTFKNKAVSVFPLYLVCSSGRSLLVLTPAGLSFGSCALNSLQH